jgi:SAM-dependent methyltransferase
MNAPMLVAGDGQSVLEIGPLNGRVFGEYLRERGWSYIAIDNSRQGNPFDPRTVDGIDYEVDARELTPVADRSVDLVIVQHVVEEIRDYEQALAQIARVLAPHGRALLEIPFDPERERSVQHDPDNFGNVWTFGRDLLGILRRRFGEVEVADYHVGAAHGRILTCRKARRGPVAVENSLPGDGHWWGEHSPVGEIEGYTTRCSVRAGDWLELHVSTNPPRRYRISVHRLGWYAGAGARTLAVHPGPRSDVQGLGRDRRAPSRGAQIESADWPVTDAIAVEKSWTTGVYVARLTLTTGEHAGQSAYVPFVVRAPLGTVADVLVQQPVSAPRTQSADDDPSWPFESDYQLLRFLEREEFDVAYTTEIDTHLEPWSLTGHRLLMTSGQSARLAPEIRQAFDDARDEGTNIAWMGANTEDVQIPDHDQGRPIVEAAAVHRAGSGALVFAAGSGEFVWGLDDWGHRGHANGDLQRFMRKVLTDLTVE